MSEAAANRGGSQVREGAGTEGLSLFSPVVERELRVALHRRDVRKSRARIARYGVIGVGLFMLFGTLTGAATWGSTLHLYLSLAGLGLAVGPAFESSVGLFAEERRQQTLQLLFLSGVGWADLFVGKLLGGVLVSSCELLALAPLLAVPFLSGGLSFELFLATAVCLPTVFVFVLALGSLASAMCKQESTALVLSGVLVAITCLVLPLPYNLGFWLTGTVPFDRSWLVLSPALGPWMVLRNFGGFRVGNFWAWTVVMWAGSALALGVAAGILKWNWQRDLEGGGARGWLAKWEALALGSAAWRKALRRRVLAANAYQWLAQQDRRPVLQAWGFIGSVCVVWLLGWCAWPRLWPSTLNFYTTAVVLLSGRDLLVAYAAARRMAADRRDGALELLLTTALSPREMLAGQRAALRAQFAPVKHALLGLLLLLVGAGLLTRGWTWQGIVSYLAVWCLFFAWCTHSAARAAPLAMWVAANCGRPLYGRIRNRGAWSNLWTLYWWGMMANSFGALGGFVRSFPTGSTAEMVVTLLAVFCLLLIIASNVQARSEVADSLVAQLRSIAQEPLPRHNDPRFKQWKDVRTRFPASSDGGEDASTTKRVKAAGAWLWKPLGRLAGLACGKVLRAATRRQPQ